MIIDIIAMIMLSVLVFVFLVATLHQRKARLDLLDQYVKSEIEKAALLDKLSELVKENETRSIEESDGFLKFVSDSRDWAFKYIEDAQSALKEFDSKVAQDVAYFDKYGMLDVDSPSRSSMARFSDAYKKLRQILPQDMVD